MVLGKTSSAGASYYIFSLVYPFSFPPSLGDGPIKTEILSQRATELKTTNHIVHFSRQCWLTAYHSPVDSEKSELHGVDLKADLRTGMPIKNYRVFLPGSATAGTYASTFIKVCSWLEK